MRPNCESVAETHASIEASSAMFVCTNDARLPRSRAAASPASSPRAASTTDAWARTNAFAIARPSIEFPPLTIATAPGRSVIARLQHDADRAVRGERPPVERDPLALQPEVRADPPELQVVAADERVGILE